MMDFKEFKKQFTEQLFDEYQVTLHLKDIAGGIPMHEDMVIAWINKMNKKKSEEERSKLVEATLQDLPQLSEEKEAKGWTTFKQDENGHFFIEGRCVKSMLKESGNIIREIVPNGGHQKGIYSGKPLGVSALKDKVADRVFVVENRIFFTKNGERISEPHESKARPIHVTTPQGKRSSLKRTDVLQDVEVEFTVRRLANNSVPEITLFGILTYVQNLGLGAERAQGRGTMKDVECEMTKEAAKDIKYTKTKAATTKEYKKSKKSMAPEDHPNTFKIAERMEKAQDIANDIGGN